MPFSNWTLGPSNTAEAAAFNVNDGLSLNKPFLFIQQALYAIQSDAYKYSQVNATIWILKGSHFFFYCYASKDNDPILSPFCL